MKRPRRAWRHGLAASAIAGCILFSSSASAGDPPWGAGLVSITAREQPIQGFLQSLFAQADISVSISPAVTGNVSGVFEGNAGEVYRNVARSFDLITYYDGVVAHVYRSSEVATRVFPVAPGVGARVRDMIAQMRLEDRHNRVQQMSDAQVLVATGTRRFLDQIEEFVNAHTTASAAEPPYEFRVFYLRYAWADDMTLSFPEREVRIPGLATMLRRMMGRAGGAYERAPPPRVALRPVQGMRERASADPLHVPTVESQSAPAPTPLQEGEVDLARLGSEQGVRIMADPRLNAIIVRDVRERMSTYADLIEALDVEPQLLQIEATIIDIDTDRMRELGVNWRWRHGRDEILFGRGDETDLALRPTGEITPRGQGLFISGVLGDVNTFTARISALEARGAARVVSSPQILTLSNLEAVFDNTRTFFVRVAGERDVDLFDITAGTSLRVVPHVSREGDQTRIRLLVSIEDGAISEAEVDDIPIVERSAISTQALIAEGESLLIGGMVIESEVEERSQTPILGGVPLLGLLFRNQQRRDGRHERLFLISPRLASPGRMLQRGVSPVSPPEQGPDQSPTQSEQEAPP